MQISKTHSLPILPVVPEPSRGRTHAEPHALTTLPQSAQESRPSRTVDEIRQAERLLDRQRSRNAFGALAEESNHERAITAYQSLQQNDERDYVSEVLGIDVYA
ncbi:MAG: endoglucanase [Candidatus Thiodiazotropha sp. (ex Monitilora ramsayi)]|nr:endoglucanase [Candidatus Thiodiazotropha sp. (ex Monitilora ramsayi)]